MKTSHHVKIIALALLLPTAALAEIPEAGLNAEAQGHWQEALDIFWDAVHKNPHDVDTWNEISSIYDQQKNLPKQISTMEEATRNNPGSVKLWQGLSQVYSAANQPAKASQAIDHAIALQPDNLDLLRDKAQLAEWSGDYPGAKQAYERILAKQPNDRKAQIGRARVMSWQGQASEARVAYAKYIAEHPDDAAAQLDQARNDMWLGDYNRAMHEVDQHDHHFGTTSASKALRAQILAYADRPRAAKTLLGPLLAAKPKDTDLLYTQTLADNNDSRPRAALADLDRLNAQTPNPAANDTLSRQVHTPLRSNASLFGSHYHDSDSIDIDVVGVDGELALQPETKLLAGAQRSHLSANQGSGFTAISGNGSLNLERYWLGAKHLISPQWSFLGKVGEEHATEGGNKGYYAMTLGYRPLDTLNLNYDLERDYYAVSPRAVSLGVTRISNQLSAQWEPNLLYTVSGNAAYRTFSDNNSNWESNLEVRRAMLRTAHYNLDLGVAGRWLSFSKDPGDGYYSPLSYRRYALTGTFYWKIDDDDGIAFTASYGLERDNTMSSYKAGGDLVVNATFGIYRDWYFNVYGSLLHNNGQNTGAYDANQIGFRITRRF